MAGNASTSKPKPRPPLFSHIIETRKISLSSSASAQTLPIDETNGERNPTLKTPWSYFSSSASAIFIGQNEDLLTEIFLCLPPKSLLRFQSVCKLWLSIISNSDFRRLHCGKFRTGCSSFDVASVFFFQKKWNQTSQLDFISFSAEDVKPMATLTSRLSNFLSGEILQLHSCNGLLGMVFSLNYDQNEFIVYNPTTGHHRLIPKCEVAEKGYRYPSINIAFDPLKSNHYKLVCLWLEQFQRILHFVVYSSETGIWRETGEAMELTDEIFYFENGVLWNGNIHWVSVCNSVLCFELDNECLNWSVPSLPAPIPHEFWYFGESKGCLYTIEVNHSQEMLFDVFELEKDYSKWFLKFRIDLTPLTILYPSMLNIHCNPSFEFPCFLVSEKEKKAKIVISLVDEVILCDINDMVVKELADIKPVEPVSPYGPWTVVMYDWHRAFTFTETLACV